MKQFAKAQGFDGEFKNWDTAYFSDKLKQERYAYSEEDVRPYFPMPKVLDGMFKLVEKIFHIHVKENSENRQTAWFGGAMVFWT